jgi:hypothetical protein
MPSPVTQNIAVVAAQNVSQLTQSTSGVQREALATPVGTQAVQAVQRVSKQATANFSAKERQQSTAPKQDAIDGSFRSGERGPSRKDPIEDEERPPLPDGRRLAVA